MRKRGRRPTKLTKHWYRQVGNETRLCSAPRRIFLPGLVYPACCGSNFHISSELCFEDISLHWRLMFTKMSLEDIEAQIGSENSTVWIFLTSASAGRLWRSKIYNICEAVKATNYFRSLVWPDGGRSWLNSTYVVFMRPSLEREHYPTGIRMTSPHANQHLPATLYLTWYSSLRSLALT
jgi:hypothetical protein